MFNIDMSALMNLLMTGLIGFVFGIASTWIAHRYQRKRDDIAWQREKEKLQHQFQRDEIAWQHEKEKLQQQFRHDRDLLEIGYLQKLKDMENEQAERIKGIENEKAERIRKQLIVGLENPAEAIAQLVRFTDLQTHELIDYRSALREGRITLSKPDSGYSYREPPSEESLRKEAEKRIEYQHRQLMQLMDFLRDLKSFLVEKGKKQS